MASATPTLQIDGLDVKSRSGRVLLGLPELTLDPGTFLGVAGPSGAGKSTFLYAIAGLLPEARGRVLWDGSDILALGGAARGRFRAARMGFVFQVHMLFEELPARDNAAIMTAFATPTDRSGLQARAADALDRLGLPRTSRRIASFSVGERQRVAIAIARARAPAILPADEPTASLGRTAADAIVADLTRAARDFGRLMVTVSHDTALLGRMHRILRLENGRPAALDRAA